MTAYQEQNIELGDKFLASGHAVFTNARYRNKGELVHIVYKKNKNENPELSRFEAAFGEIARLFLPFELTANQTLVKNNKSQVVGVCAEQISYAIMRREGLSRKYYQLYYHSDKFNCVACRATQFEEIPYYFFRQFKPGFFKALRMAEANGKIALNMESLAGVLTASYSLEEDDLHKGNFGFYVVEKNAKPEVVFFKIDHDLMMADSVMSFCNTRFLNWFNGSDAFKITAGDLLNFPCLKDSKNYYWPTAKRVLSSAMPYAYSSNEEVEAFASLAQTESFKREKWRCFYKHILVPPEIIRASLARPLDMSVPKDRAKIALVTQSVVARQAKLRAVLFTLPEFRNFVSSLTLKDLEEIKTSIMSQAAVFTTYAQEIIQKKMEHYGNLCKQGAFVHNDTPLHAAIRLGDYRYHETHTVFSEFLDKKNSWGQTPLDLAISMIKSSDATDIRGNLRCTIKHLIQVGAEKTPSFDKFCKNKEEFEDYFFPTGYPSKARLAHSAQELRNVLREIGEDYRYSLKMQKQIAVICVRQFIEANQQHPCLKTSLRELKVALNSNSSSSTHAPELNFIRQLRSQLWIVRIFRGLFGGSSTKAEINSLIDRGLKINQTTGQGVKFFSVPEKDKIGLTPITIQISNPLK